MTPEDLFTLLLATVRYSLGRSTYMSSLAWELVVKYEKDLPTEQLRQIRNEIQESLDRVESMGDTLGFPIDHEAWQQGVKALDQILKERQ